MLRIFLVQHLKSSSIFMLILLLGLFVFGLSSNSGSAQTATVPVAVAVTRAFASAQSGGPGYAGMVGQPTEIRGQVMTYEQAEQFIHGRPIQPNTLMWNIRDKPVWLIVFRGNFEGRVPAVQGTTFDKPSFSQFAEILDGNTAEIMRTTLIPPQKELSINSLPLLSLPLGSVPSAPTRAPISTVAPLPTITSAPQRP